MPPPLLPHLEVVKVVGAPPAYPPTLMANPPLLHTWLLPGTSTYQVCHGFAASGVTRLLVFLLTRHVRCHTEIPNRNPVLLLAFTFSSIWVARDTCREKLSEQSKRARRESFDQAVAGVAPFLSLARASSNGSIGMSHSCQRLCVFRVVFDSKQLFLSLPSSQLPLWWSSRAQTWDASLKNRSSPLLVLQMEKNVFTGRKKNPPHWK